MQFVQRSNEIPVLVDASILTGYASEWQHLRKLHKYLVLCGHIFVKRASQPDFDTFTYNSFFKVGTWINVPAINYFSGDSNLCIWGKDHKPLQCLAYDDPKQH